MENNEIAKIALKRIAIQIALGVVVAVAVGFISGKILDQIDPS